MNLTLYTVVHPIGPDDIPGHPLGWRWAIHTDERFDQVETGCINAGFEVDQQGAESMLSCVLITARRALTAAGGSSAVVATTLDTCPLAADVVTQLAVLR